MGSEIIGYFMGNFSLGLTLMAVGMITVFAILLIVIYLSKLLIVLINKYAPAEVPPAKGSAAGAVSPVVRRIIAATVAQITGGRGRVKSIDKL